MSEADALGETLRDWFTEVLPNADADEFGLCDLSKLSLSLDDTDGDVDEDTVEAPDADERAETDKGADPLS